jgi:hypothetical protein
VNLITTYSHIYSPNKFLNVPDGTQINYAAGFCPVLKCEEAGTQLCRDFSQPIRLVETWRAGHPNTILQAVETGNTFGLCGNTLLSGSKAISQGGSYADN